MKKLLTEEEMIETARTIWQRFEETSSDLGAEAAADYLDDYLEALREEGQTRIEALRDSA